MELLILGHYFHVSWQILRYEPVVACETPVSTYPLAASSSSGNWVYPTQFWSTQFYFAVQFVSQILIDGT